jgi:hypothetical protein
MTAAMQGPSDLVVVRVMTRETIQTLRLIAYMAESNLDTLPPSMQHDTIRIVEFLRELRVSDVVVRSETAR